jgi:hypothetical protein
MRRIPIAINMAGFAYDPDQPTLQTEMLSYAQRQILDALVVGGYEYRQAEAADIVAVDATVKSYVDSVRAQAQGGASVAYEALSSSDALLAPGAVEGLISGRVSAALKSEDKESVAVTIPDLTGIAATLEALRVQIDFLCNREEILNIGSHVVWTKSMAVDEL